MTARVDTCRLVHVAAAELTRDCTEQQALEAALDEIAPAFDATPEPSREGGSLGVPEGATEAAREGASESARAGALLVVTEDAGSATALKFWRGALAVGPALASPAAFPWCLANAACGTLARRFRIVGPSVTWLAPLGAEAGALGATLALPAAWWLDHLLGSGPHDEAQHAWIVALRFRAGAGVAGKGGGAGRAVAWHWVLDTTTLAPEAVEPRAATMGATMARQWAPAG